MAAGTLASRILGFIKGILIAYALLATSNVANIFDSANYLPNLLYIMLAGGVFNVVLVPQIIKASKLPDRGSDYLSRLMTLCVTGLVIITLILALLARPLMALTTGLSGQNLDLATHFAVWLLPQIFFYGFYTLLGQILNAHDRFGSYMWAPVLNNIVAIIGILAFIAINGLAAAHPHTVENWSSGQTLLLAGTTTLGVVLQALILIGPIRKLGLRLHFAWGWRGIGLASAGKIAGWALGTMIVGNLSYLVIARVANLVTQRNNSSEQSVAGLFIFNRASDIYLLPHSIIVLSIATILFNQWPDRPRQGTIRR